LAGIASIHPRRRHQRRVEIADSSHSSCQIPPAGRATARPLHVQKNHIKRAPMVARRPATPSDQERLRNTPTVGPSSAFESTLPSANNGFESIRNSSVNHFGHAT